MGEDPFEVMIAAHHAEVHRYLARVTGRASDADDLSQETFIRAFRAYRALPDGANVRAWLFTIATNLCRNHWRAEGRRRRAHAAVDPPATDGGRPDGELVASQTAARLDRIVTGLPLKQRVAFTLRKVHELDYEAIGSGLGCSAESARAHVFQALRKIRRGLDDLASVHGESRHEPNPVP
jgi:RNA polymerase sigma-70 factor (ECF subfamily)